MLPSTPAPGVPMMMARQLTVLENLPPELSKTELRAAERAKEAFLFGHLATVGGIKTTAIVTDMPPLSTQSLSAARRSQDRYLGIRKLAHLLWLLHTGWHN